MTITEINETIDLGHKKFRDRYHLKGGVSQGYFLSLFLNYLIRKIHFHILYIMSY